MPVIVFLKIGAFIVILFICIRRSKKDHEVFLPTTQTTVVQNHSYGSNDEFITCNLPHQTIYGSPPPFVQQSQSCICCKGVKPLSVINPCGHQCVCLECGTFLRNKGYLCPVCNSSIESVCPKY